jgi:hypothetical protein
MERLNLANCLISDAVAERLASSLCHLQSLAELNLRGNDISASGAVALARTIAAVSARAASSESLEVTIDDNPAVTSYWMAGDHRYLGLTEDTVLSVLARSADPLTAVTEVIARLSKHQTFAAAARANAAEQWDIVIRYVVTRGSAISEIARQIDRKATAMAAGDQKYEKLFATTADCLNAWLREYGWLRRSGLVAAWQAVHSPLTGTG